MARKGKGKGEESPLFPDKLEWWKDTPQKTGNDGKSDGNANYSSFGPVVDNGDAKGEEEEGEASFVVDQVLPSDFPDCLVCGGDPGDSECGDPVEVPSDISNRSSSSDTNDDDDDGSDDDDSDSDYGSSEYEDEVEEPHRTLGLIFFDFLRFVALSANMRCVNTQMFPVFLAWGQMEWLQVALRVFITLFSLLLVAVEFPGLFPFLRYSFDDARWARSPPPLSIINWIPRGVFYIFIGIVCFEQTIVVRALDEARHASDYSRFFDGFFIVVSAWCMVITGAVYVLFGALCVQKVMERVRRDEKEKWKEYYEKVHQLELEQEEEDEREWLLEKYGSEDGEPDSSGVGGWRSICCYRWRRWRRRCKRRRARGQGGLFYQLGCRTVDWKC